MPLAKLQFPPGISRDGSRYSSTGRWADGDKVRFRQGAPEKIGGWSRSTTTAFNGTARSINEWSLLDGTIISGIGTNTKFYVERGGEPYDITPIRRTQDRVAALSVQSGSKTLTVTDASHGAIEGDEVSISGLNADLGGVPLSEINNKQIVASVVDGNTYTVTLQTTATSTATNTGDTTTFTYLLNVGLASATLGNGWGAGTWGGVVVGGTDTGWGDAANITISTAQIRLWSQDTFGQDLIINPRNGSIYYWAASGGFSARAVALSSMAGATGVPAVTTEILVSDSDRRLICFGATDQFTGVQDRLLIRWSDTEAPMVMTPRETNAAGDLRIPVGAEFVTAIETKQEILVWSDTALHSLRFVGAPFIYGITAIGRASIIAPNAKASANDVVYWMGQGSFYRYDGRIMPIPCSVKDYVFLDLNVGQTQKIVAGSNTSYNEVWWFYPSENSIENNRYVAYNYVEDCWSYGTLSRTAWLDRGISEYPKATSTDGYVYLHEIGDDDGSTSPVSPIVAYIESGPVEIAEGDRFVFVWRMIPDVTFRDSQGSPVVTFTLTGQDYPGAAQGETVAGGATRTATFPVEQFTQQLNMRLRARSVALRVSSDGTRVGWRLGIPRIDIRPDGRR